MWSDERNPGHVLADEGLQIQLDYDPVEYFYHSDKTALYARLSPSQEWTQLRVHDMPQYYEHLSSREGLWAAAGEPLPPLRPMDLAALKPPDARNLDGIQCRVTDYLPYAEMQTRWVAGGGMPNPLIRLSVRTAQGEDDGELLASESGQRPWRPSGAPPVEFRWASTAAQRAELTQVSKPQLVVRVESKNVEQVLDLSELQDAEPITIEGTDCRITLREVVPEGVINTAGSPGLVLVRVTKGPFVGPAVGLGPQGGLRPEHLDHLPHSRARSHQGRRQGFMDGRAGGDRDVGYAVQLDRGELLHHRFAQLRVRPGFLSRRAYYESRGL